MASSLSKRQKRDKLRKENYRLEQERQAVKKQKQKLEQEKLLMQQQQIVQNNHAQYQQEVLKKQMVAANPTSPTPDSNFIINYIADRNGCGYYRCIWPFELLATYKNMISMNCFVYQLDPNVLRRISTFRFQRQATDPQLNAWNNYLMMRKTRGFRYKMQYEIDDLLMEIEPHNKIAYQYFDAKKKQNHMEMLKSADSITFSTDALKDIYVKDYGIDANKIIVVRNHLPQFLYSLPYRSTPKEFNSEHKPRIFWGGSASHIGKGGDLDFILPMIIKTVDEYKWVFHGVIPPELTDYVKQGKIEFIPWTPIYGMANVQFYRAKPDICIAPLRPSKFNSAKSDLKYLESCALGAPCITTSFEQKGLKSPYDIAQAEICIEDDPDIWKSMIDHLITNPDYYIETVKAQYHFLNGRWMENNIDFWQKSVE